MLPAAVRFTLSLTLDGAPLSGFPAERRVTDDQVERLTLKRAADGLGVFTYQEIPATPTETALVLLTTDAPVRVAVNGQAQDHVTDIPLAADGVILLSNVTLSNATSQLATANPTTTPATLTVLVANLGLP